MLAYVFAQTFQSQPADVSTFGGFAVAEAEGVVEGEGSPGKDATHSEAAISVELPVHFANVNDVEKWAWMVRFEVWERMAAPGCDRIVGIPGD